jgi:amino acid adenylation domain-containing protein
MTVQPADTRSIHGLFEAQARRTPERLAVACDGVSLSYRELNEQANRLAHHLVNLGIGAGSFVGICTERSARTMVAILGVLKAGAAYIALATDNPAPRLAQQLINANALITEQGLLSRMPAIATTLCLDRDEATWAGQPETNPGRPVTADDLVYVIYTSGSTGQPKGVAVRHRNLVNYASFMAQQLCLDQYSEGLQFATVSTFSADLGNTCIYPSLISGGCLHIIASDVATDPSRLAGYFARHPIDVLKIVPSHLAALLYSGLGKQLLPRQWLITGGEALNPGLVEQVRTLDSALRMLNHYGPTETTVGSLTFDLAGYDTRGAGAASVPIGQPIANTWIYILDEQLQPVPNGTPGELFIGGAGVAAGYLNQPALTSARFLDDPFNAEAGARMYRTGDRVCRLDDGAVRFLGRADDQVKIRGFRVELGEIEAALLTHPAVRQAVVVARNDEHRGVSLIAYVVPADAGGSGAAGLRTHLEQALPDYMVPKTVMTLSALPLNANGKIDRAALPQPVAADDDGHASPRTPLEETLAQLWREVLKVPRIGIHDNFFEAGGHSLLAIQVVSRLRGAFKVSLPPQAVFTAPTIATLAESLTALLNKESAPAAPKLVPLARTAHQREAAVKVVNS